VGPVEIQKPPIVIFANKADLDPEVKEEQVRADWSDKVSSIHFVSALTNNSVQESFSEVSREAREFQRMLRTISTDISMSNSVKKLRSFHKSREALQSNYTKGRMSLPGGGKDKENGNCKC